MITVAGGMRSGSRGTHQSRSTGGTGAVTGTGTRTTQTERRTPVRGRELAATSGTCRTCGSSRQRGSSTTRGGESTGRAPRVAATRMQSSGSQRANPKKKPLQTRRSQALSCQGHCWRTPTHSGGW
ncbi:hypothetical protein Nmel_017514 [Mimus melanotis]